VINPEKRSFSAPAFEKESEREDTEKYTFNVFPGL